MARKSYSKEFKRKVCVTSAKMRNNGIIWEEISEFSGIHQNILIKWLVEYKAGKYDVIPEAEQNNEIVKAINDLSFNVAILAQNVSQINDRLKATAEIDIDDDISAVASMIADEINGKKDE